MSSKNYVGSVTSNLEMEGVTPKEDHHQLIDEVKSVFPWLPTEFEKVCATTFWDGLVLAIQKRDFKNSAVVVVSSFSESI